MSTSKAKDFFEKLNTDPKAQELFKNKEKPNTPDEMTKAYADAAKELGFELTAEDIAEFIKEEEQEIKRGTDSAAKAIEKLPDDKLENVAGGYNCVETWELKPCAVNLKDHRECKDTYYDRENCWFNDGCDHVINSYDHYICDKSSYQLK